jgi:carboxyl-terminal processing protease
MLHTMKLLLNLVLFFFAGAEAFTTSSGHADVRTHSVVLFGEPRSRKTDPPREQVHLSNSNKKNPSIVSNGKNIVFACLLGFLSTTTPLPSSAAGYGSLSPEQKFAAEAWRTVDSTFLDRTFNSQDWFKIRQDLLKTKYKNMDESRTAVSNMLSSLGDKYTRYLSPAKYQSMIDTATGTLAGVGVEIATDKDGHVIVSDVEPNSPAMKAGLKPNDIFLEGDGTRFDSSSTPDDVALKVRGPVGSKVGIVVQRDGQTIDFIITRDPITVTSVRSYMGNANVGVIRIKSFSATTSQTVSEKFNELKKKGAKKVVIDLRSNPGGLLPGGVDAAGLFLEANKPVVYVVSNKGVVASEQTFQDGVDLETPIFLFVDHNTVSACFVMFVSCINYLA